MVAFCYASGEIQFGPTVPEGAIEIASGPAPALRQYVAVAARHARQSDALIVPGVPEATNEDAAVDALVLWMRWMKRYVPDGITLATERPALSDAEIDQIRSCRSR